MKNTSCSRPTIPSKREIYILSCFFSPSRKDCSSHMNHVRCFLSPKKISLRGLWFNCATDSFYQNRGNMSVPYTLLLFSFLNYIVLCGYDNNEIKHGSLKFMSFFNSSFIYSLYFSQTPSAPLPISPRSIFFHFFFRKSRSPRDIIWTENNKLQ